MTNGYSKSLLTTRELAHMLNVHINTVRRWSDQGILKSYRIGPRCDRRFSREDVALFLEQTSKTNGTGAFMKVGENSVNHQPVS